MSETPHKSGFVSIIGKPNAGKSTLLNSFLGQKLVIATKKAQTTRHRIFGILSDENYQIVFSDTPGVIRPKYSLQKHMMGFVDQAFEDADIILLLIDVNEKFPENEMLNRIASSGLPVILAVNKMDRASEEKIALRMQEVAEKVNPAETIAISALNKMNTDILLELILKHLPEGPPYYDKESLSDRPERFFISEIIREKVFVLLEDELPYSSEVSVLDFNEEFDIIRISAEIHVNRKSQKGMVIGKGGRMIRKIGTYARQDLEEFLDKKVFLELYVRVSEGWKDDSRRLRYFGYDQ